jgi:hypothetical protein
MKRKHTHSFGGVLVVPLRVPIGPSYLAQVEVNSLLNEQARKWQLAAGVGLTRLDSTRRQKNVTLSRGKGVMVEAHSMIFLPGHYIVSRIVY